RHADQLILEARNEGVRADLDRDVVAAAALERLAVHRADELDHDTVALLDLAALALRAERAARVRYAADRLVDLVGGPLGREPLERDLLEVGERDRRHHLERHRIGEIGLAVDDLLDLALALRHGDLRVHGELEAVVGDDLGVGLAHQLVDRLGHDAAAIDLLEVGDRNLAGPEAAQLDAVLELRQAVIEPGIELGRRHDHLEFALEAVGVGFGDLHGSIARRFALKSASVPISKFASICG